MATETLRPNAVGDEENLNPVPGTGEDNYENVDEVTRDNAATYNYSPVADNNWRRDLYNIENHSVGSGVINKITIYACCRASDTPDQTGLKIALKTGGTVYESGEKTLGTWWVPAQTWELTTNPDTSLPFTWSEIDSLQIGTNMRKSHSSNPYWSGCTQLYMEVDYTLTIVMGALIATEEAVHAPQVNLAVHPTAVATEEAVYAPQANLNLALLAIATGEAIYAPSLGMWIEPGNIATAEAIYEAIVAGPILTEAIATAEAIYEPQQLSLKLHMVAIPTSEALHAPQINFTVYPSTFIVTGEAIYEPIVAGPIIMAAIPTSEAIYAPQINLTIFPLRIETEEAVYAPDVILAIFAPAGLEYIVELHDSSGDLVAVLERASSIAWTRTINEAPLLSFVMPADDSKIASISRNDEIWLRNYYTGEVLGKFLIYLEKDNR